MLVYSCLCKISKYFNTKVSYILWNQCNLGMPLTVFQNLAYMLQNPKAFQIWLLYVGHFLTLCKYCTLF